MERPARWHTYVYPLHLERTEGCIYIGISIVGFHTDSTPPATLFQDSWVAHACWSFAPPLHPCSSAAGKPLRRSDAIITLPSSPFLPMHLLTLSTTFAPRALSNVRAYCIPKRASLYASLAVTVISRLAGSVCIPQINLLYLSNPSSSLFFYNSSQLSSNFTSIRSLAGEKSKFFEWIFPSRTKEEGACTHRRVSGLLDEYEVVGRGAIEVELNFRGNSIGVPSVI